MALVRQASSVGSVTFTPSRRSCTVQLPEGSCRGAGILSFFSFSRSCFFPHQLQYSEFSGISREQLQHFISDPSDEKNNGGISLYTQSAGRGKEKSRRIRYFVGIDREALPKFDKTARRRDHGKGNRTDRAYSQTVGRAKTAGHILLRAGDDVAQGGAEPLPYKTIFVRSRKR